MAGKVGRPKGSGRGTHAATILKGAGEQSLERIMKKYGQNPQDMFPLELFYTIYNDTSVDLKTRMAAAERCLPYMHQRLPDKVEHEHTGSVENVHRFTLATKLFGLRRAPAQSVEGPPQLTEEPPIDADYTETRPRVSAEA